MTSQPKPGEVLNGESVKLLLPGDVLRFIRPDPYTSLQAGSEVTFDCLNDGFIEIQETEIRGYHHEKLTFVSRPLEPSCGQDGGGEREGWPTTVAEHLEVAARVLKGIAAPSVNDGEIVAYSVSDDVPEDISVALSYVEAAIQALASPAKVTGWPGIETAPKGEPGLMIDVRSATTYRWLPYRGKSEQFRKGIKGRWQRATEYGWENAKLPTEGGEWAFTKVISAPRPEDEGAA